MEIQCPSCQKKLIIDDQFAGQLTKCPSCNGVFMAPTLVTPPVMAAPEPPKREVIPFTSEPPPPRPPIDVIAPAPPRPAADAVFEQVAPPPPPLPPGDFSKSHTMRLCPDGLRWVMPGALTVLFVVSFLTWIYTFTGIWDGTMVVVKATDLSLWSLAFGDAGTVGWIFYVLLTIFLALPLAWARLLLDMGVIPTPAFLKPFWDWRFALLGGILGITFFIALFGRMQVMPNQACGFGMFLGLILHVVALIACCLESWLANRTKANLPKPELIVRY